MQQAAMRNFLEDARAELAEIDGELASIQQRRAEQIELIDKLQRSMLVLEGVDPGPPRRSAKGAKGGALPTITEAVEYILSCP